MDAEQKCNVLVTVVVPVYNEEENLRPLYASLKTVLDRLDNAYQLIFIDDGSTDGSPDVLKALGERDDQVEIVRLRRNLGKAMALAAGFRRARGDVVVTMDGDLQDDPEEIPRFLGELERGFDLVCGWRKARQDPASKVLLSRIYNWATRTVTGVPLRDSNCGLKACRRDVLTDLRLYGDLHRYIPALASWRGYRVGELPVRHHPRRHGRSKYGTARLLHGLLDLLTVVFLTRYDKRPLHLLGGAGILMSLLGLGINLYLTGLWILGYRPIGNRPLLFFGILFLLVGVQFVFFGLLAEFQLHLHLRADDRYLDDLIVSPRTGTPDPVQVLPVRRSEEQWVGSGNRNRGRRWRLRAAPRAGMGPREPGTFCPSSQTGGLSDCSAACSCSKRCRA